MSHVSTVPDTLHLTFNLVTEEEREGGEEGRKEGDEMRKGLFMTNM